MNIKGISMGKPHIFHAPWVRLTFMIIIIAGCLGAVALPPVRETVTRWFAAKGDGPARAHAQKKTVELIQSAGSHGLRVSPEAVTALEISSVEVKPALEPRPMPPQLGQVNYDNNHLFVKRTQFPGEIVEFGKVVDTTGPYSPTRYRSIRFGDRVKQDDLLAVIWSRELLERKAALIDAVSNLRLSEDTLERHQTLLKQGNLPIATIMADERQVKADRNAVVTAERIFRIWKLPEEEIDKIKEEAKIISAQKKPRSPEYEKNWARVEIRAPKFDDDPRRELVILTKNNNLGEFVDPSRDTPLFILADLSRLQIWVYPPTEYLPPIREQLQRGGNLKWLVRFQADPPNTPPLELDIAQISPSVDPNQQRPMLIGYLPNPEGKRLIGDFLTATIFLPPEPDCVEIPTDALNQKEGQDLVFVEPGSGKGEFYLRRVAVVKSFSKTSFVRSRLTPEDEALSRSEEKKGRRPLEPLLPGERVITRGVLELTTALEDALSTQKSKAE